MEKCSCIHCSERRMAISSTMEQFLEFVHISCYTSTCIVSMMLFCVNKEAILLSIQIIIKIFIFFYSWCFFFVDTKSKVVYCSSGRYSNGYKYTYYITMGSNEKFSAISHTFSSISRLLMNLHRAICARKKGIEMSPTVAQTETDRYITVERKKVISPWNKLLIGLALSIIVSRGSKKRKKKLFSVFSKTCQGIEGEIYDQNFSLNVNSIVNGRQAGNTFFCLPLKTTSVIDID